MLRGLVVAPGFIDLHSHSPYQPGDRIINYRDGVTTALELEAGSFPSSAYGERIVGRARTNYGSSAGYIWARLRVKQGVEMVHVTSTPSIIGWKGGCERDTQSCGPTSGPGFSARAG